jgi:hypothetical protein
VNFGDGFATISDPDNPRYGYAMSQGGSLVRFDKETGERKAIRPAHPNGVHLRFNWNAGIAIDVRAPEHGHGRHLDDHQPRPHNQRS